jgi:hypothetical protein
VQWTEPTVFAGEDIECEITFKNIASTPTPSRTTLHPAAANGFGPGAERQRKAPLSQVKPSATLSPRPAVSRGHRTTLSLNVPASSVRPPPISGPWNGGPPKLAQDGGSHKRSVSIISIGAGESGIEDIAGHGSVNEKPRGLSRGHGRSASLQIVPRRHAINGGPTSGEIYSDGYVKVC